MEIVLKARTKNHVSIFWEKTQDEEIKSLFPSSIKSLDEAFVLFEESLKENAQSYGKVIYCDENYVGDIWCYGIDERDEKMAMLSIVIFEKELWGKGVASEATKHFIMEVFKKYDIDKIGAFTYANNHRTINLFKRIGFVQIEAFIEDGIESIYFEIGKKE